MGSESPLVAAVDGLGVRVLVGAAADEVEEDEGDGGDDERDVGLVPLAPQRRQEARAARLALVAQLRRVVAPQAAVRVGRGPRRVRPHRRAHVPEPAHRRGLAATRLHPHHTTPEAPSVVRDSEPTFQLSYSMLRNFTGINHPATLPEAGSEAFFFSLNHVRWSFLGMDA